ncbi:hypothetical protein HYT26_00540 [Candidatus Pacearchaeota archaeon]|nr:hypothetical protein [Candidatus Pacearchaeota archaeon]
MKYLPQKFTNLINRVDWGVVCSTSAQFCAATLTGINLLELLKGAENPAYYATCSIGGLFLYIAARDNKDAKFLKSDDKEDDFQITIRSLEGVLEDLKKDDKAYKNNA